VRRVRALVSADSRPLIPKGVRMHYDKVREKYAVLGPERVYWPDSVSVDILNLCDGQLSVSGIAQQLAQSYAAPAGTIEADVLEFIQSWTDLHLLNLKEC
jgi:pyrroloquinoline quinone biosynthesis protein D